MGFSPRAQANIQALRTAEKYVSFFELRPRQDLLRGREENEAYLAAKPGKAYVLFFPAGGKVSVLMEGAISQYQSSWIDLQTGKILREGPAYDNTIKSPINTPCLGIIYQAVL